MSPPRFTVSPVVVLNFSRMPTLAREIAAWKFGQARFGEARAVHAVAARVTNDVADAFKLR
jgi:hypothetical protein